MNRKNFTSIILIIALVFSAFPVLPAEAVNPFKSLQVDISGSANLGDYSWGIYHNPSNQYVWMTLFEQGGLVRLDKDTNETAIFTRPGGASGQLFYALTEDGSGNLWITGNGTVWRYTPANNSWASLQVTEIPVPPTTNVEETCAVYHGGYVWLCGYYSFGAGFNGIYKIDPSTVSVERIDLGAGEIIGAVGDGDFLYITERTSGKVIRYNITSGVGEVFATGITEAFHIDQDASSLYVAARTMTGNVSFAKVSKSTGSKTLYNLSSLMGPSIFNLKVEGNFLFYSGTENNIGRVNLLNSAVVKYTTSYSTNRFIAKVGSYMWVAGQGSSYVAMLEIPTSSPTPPGEEPPDPILPLVTIQVNSTLADAGDVIRISGNVTYQGHPVSCELVIRGTSGAGHVYGELGRAYSSLNGSYSFDWTASKPGVIFIQALAFAPQSVSVSEDVRVKVKQIVPPVLPPQAKKPLQGVGSVKIGISGKGNLYQIALINQDQYFQKRGSVWLQVKNSAGVIIYLREEMIEINAAGDMYRSVVVPPTFTVEIFFWNNTLPLSEKTSFIAGA